jgi:hypothetical protein
METGQLAILRDPKTLETWIEIDKHDNKPEQMEEEKGKNLLKKFEYKMIQIRPSLSSLYIIDPDLGEVIENFNIGFFGFSKFQKLCTETNNEMSAVTSRILDLIGFDDKEKNGFWKLVESYSNFRYICSFLDFRDLSVFLNCCSKLRKSCWESNSFWFGLYVERFVFTGFEVDQIEWRMVYAKKLKSL